jgi:hypothetical protein
MPDKQDLAIEWHPGLVIWHYLAYLASARGCHDKRSRMHDKRADLVCDFSVFADA